MAERTMIIAENLAPGLLGEIRKLVPEWRILAGKDPAHWQSEVKKAEVIASFRKKMEKDALSEDSALRWVQSWSAGVDSFPLEQFEKKELFLTSASGIHAYPISETIFAMMLALTRKIHTYVRNQTKKKWDHAGLKLEMHEKVIGIIGVGEIGLETAKIAKAFGMKVLGVRRSGAPAGFVDEMYTNGQLHDMLPLCDYVAVCLPLTKETYHLFGKEAFARMKPSAFFINIGRGEIANEKELADALASGEIAGAGLDVFEKEPLPEDSPLWELENVIITPHTAGSTEHYDERVVRDIFIPNLKRYLAGGKPDIHLVDYKKGY